MAKKNAKSKKVPVRTGVPKATVPKPMQATMPHISDCAEDYGRCLANPFTGPLACVPGSIPIRTWKTRFWNRGTIVVGANGIGYIVADPLNFSVNNLNSVHITDSTFAGPGFSAVAGSITAQSNSTFTFAQIGGTGSLMQVRVVGFGVRIRYSGTELNRAGTIYSFHDPTHSTLLNETAATLGDEEQMKRFPVSRDWTTVTYSPVIADDFQLNPFLSVNFNTAGANRWYIGHLIAGAVPGVSFDYEVYGVYEFNGQTVRGMTVTHSDPIGLAAAVTVSQAAPPSQGSGEVREVSFLSKMGHELTHAFSTALSVYQGGKAVVETAQDIRSMYRGGAPRNFIENVKDIPMMLAYR